MHAKKTAFIVEHDFIMAAYLADRVIVYEGEASVNATARAPQSLLTGKSSPLNIKNTMEDMPCIIASGGVFCRDVLACKSCIRRQQMSRMS